MATIISYIKLSNNSIIGWNKGKYFLSNKDCTIENIWGPFKTLKELLKDEHCKDGIIIYKKDVPKGDLKLINYCFGLKNN